MDRTAVIAKCDEVLRFLADNDEQRKLRRLAEDIADLRDRLRAELDTQDTRRNGQPLRR
jgi:hypothetical protein